MFETSIRTDVSQCSKFVNIMTKSSIISVFSRCYDLLKTNVSNSITIEVYCALEINAHDILYISVNISLKKLNGTVEISKARKTPYTDHLIS